jgi:hypothetical protein
MLTKKKQVIGSPSIALEAPILEGPVRKIPPLYLARPLLGIFIYLTVVNGLMSN